MSLNNEIPHDSNTQIIPLLEGSNGWNMTFECAGGQIRLHLNHGKALSITTDYMEGNRDELRLSSTVLREIVVEIKKRKRGSAFDSVVLFEDTTGDYLLSLELEPFHDFTVCFVIYSADFQFELKGYANQLEVIHNAVCKLLDIEDG